MKQYWTYMLRCSDGSYYIGVTSELERRVAKYNVGWNPDSYTFRRRPVALVHAEVFSTPDEAIAAKKRLKGWSRAKKEALTARRLGEHSSLGSGLGWRSPFDKLRVTLFLRVRLWR